MTMWVTVPALLLLYAWGVFPLLLEFFYRLSYRYRAPRPASALPPFEPPVTVVLSAFNEERHIAARIHNLLLARYPSDKLRIHVGVDGASDRTAAVAREAARGDTRVAIHEFPVNRGKVAVLKELVHRSERPALEDILVFTDANTEFEPDALDLLTRPFADPCVGGVCGRLVFVRAEGGETHENVYWRWESRLKRIESAADSCLGANGAIYAVRRALFWQALPECTIIDDFVIGMKVRERGYRVRYEPEARATEVLPETVRDEWTRRVRIGSGAFQSIRYCAGCLLPRYRRFAWFFWSHKILRWLTPHLLLALWGCGAATFASVLIGGGDPFTAPHGWNTLVTGTSLLLLPAAAIGHWRRRDDRPLLAPFRVCAYFVAMQTALFAGFLRFCRGGLKGSWQRTRRT